MLEEANLKLKRENESLTQKFIASLRVVSDLNTKIKDLENDKLSLLTTIKLIQIQEKKAMKLYVQLKLIIMMSMQIRFIIVM